MLQTQSPPGQPFVIIIEVARVNEVVVVCLHFEYIFFQKCPKVLNTFDYDESFMFHICIISFPGQEFL